jgi:hypothetical protein
MFRPMWSSSGVKNTGRGNSCLPLLLMLRICVWVGGSCSLLLEHSDIYKQIFPKNDSAPSLVSQPRNQDEAGRNKSRFLPVSCKSLICLALRHWRWKLHISLGNVGWLSPDYTTIYRSRQYSSFYSSSTSCGLWCHPYWLITITKLKNKLRKCLLLLNLKIVIILSAVLNTEDRGIKWNKEIATGIVCRWLTREARTVAGHQQQSTGGYTYGGLSWILNHNNLYTWRWPVRPKHVKTAR